MQARRNAAALHDSKLFKSIALRKPIPGPLSNITKATRVYTTRPATTRKQYNGSRPFSTCIALRNSKPKKPIPPAPPSPPKGPGLNGPETLRARPPTGKSFFDPITPIAPTIEEQEIFVLTHFTRPPPLIIRGRRPSWTLFGRWRGPKQSWNETRDSVFTKDNIPRLGPETQSDDKIRRLVLNIFYTWLFVVVVDKADMNGYFDSLRAMVGLSPRQVPNKKADNAGNVNAEDTEDTEDVEDLDDVPPTRIDEPGLKEVLVDGRSK